LSSYQSDKGRRLCCRSRKQRGGPDVESVEESEEDRVQAETVVEEEDREADGIE
jgi:hypothetical protein